MHYKSFFILLFILLCALPVWAQAVAENPVADTSYTADGRVIVLFKDGTYKTLDHTIALTIVFGDSEMYTEAEFDDEASDEDILQGITDVHESIVDDDTSRPFNPDLSELDVDHDISDSIALALFPQDCERVFNENWNTEVLFSYGVSNINSFLPARITLVDENNPYTPPLMGPINRGFTWYHAGMDIDLETGDTIRSSFSGKVRFVESSRYGYGKVVVIRHCNGLETLYGHLSSILVEPNQYVQSGDVIGLGGNTGRSTGPHLHYEIRFMGKAMDPAKIVNFDSGELLSSVLTIKPDLMYASNKGKSRYTKSRRGNYTATSRYTKSKSKSSSHTVRRGESLSTIARKNGISVSKLKKLNGIKGDKIKAGQKIRVK